MNSASVVAQLTELNDEGDGEPEGGDAEDRGEDPLGGPAGGLEPHQDVSCGSSIPHIREKAFLVNNQHLCSAQTVTRIGLLEEIPRSGVQIPCLS